jgi:NAD(P)-dependent dehydrogenase (short-subunit alcohol dehydrogenase family)
VNYLGLRHLTEGLLSFVPPHGAIVHVASRTGLGWRSRLPELLSIVSMDVDAAAQAFDHIEGAQENPYRYSKELVITYTMARAAEICGRGIRMNCIAPGAVDTPMMRDAVVPLVGAEIIERAYRSAGRPGTAEEMARPMLFLASSGASYVSGATLIIDFAGDAGGITGRLDPVRGPGSS